MGKALIEKTVLLSSLWWTNLNIFVVVRVNREECFPPFGTSKCFSIALQMKIGRSAVLPGFFRVCCGYSNFQNEMKGVPNKPKATDKCYFTHEINEQPLPPHPPHT